MMNKKAISPLIAVIIIIGLVVTLSAVFFAWSQGLFKATFAEGTKLNEKILRCSPNIEVDILDVCTLGKEQIRIIIENKKETSINGNFFFIRIDGPQEGFVVPTRPFTNLAAFDRETIEVAYPQLLPSIERVTVIPRLESEDGAIICTGNAPAFENIEDCAP